MTKTTTKNKEKKKRGPKNPKGFSIKYINDEYYLYKAVLDLDATERKKEELIKGLNEFGSGMFVNKKGREIVYRRDQVDLYATTYRWISQGNINFDNPKDKFEAWLRLAKPETVAKVAVEFEKAKTKREKRGA